MLISIVIPVYKVENYIERCINSVIAQDYQGGLECLLIDDCSPDNSMAIVSKVIDNYVGPISFRVFRHEKNRGLSAARNTGIDNALGEYVYFLDSDDYIASNCISSLATPLSERYYDIVIGNYTVVGSNEEFPPLRLGNKELNSNADVLDSYICRDWYMMAWNKLCSLSFIRKYSLYFKEGIIHEDNLWSFQYACLARSLRCVNVPTYYYCIREGSIMNSSQKLESQRGILLGLRCMIDFVNLYDIALPYSNDYFRKTYINTKNNLVDLIIEGAKLDNKCLNNYRYVSSILKLDESIKAKFLKFLILNSQRIWASMLLKTIHRALVSVFSNNQKR